MSCWYTQPSVRVLGVSCHFTSTQTQIYTHRFPVCTPSVASRGPCHLLRVFEAAVWCERRDGFVLLFFHLKEWIVPCKPLKWRASTSIFSKGWINLFQFGLRFLLVKISTAWHHMLPHWFPTALTSAFEILSNPSLLISFDNSALDYSPTCRFKVSSRLLRDCTVPLSDRALKSVICRAFCHVPCIMALSGQ